jgi:hypothetical protein
MQISVINLTRELDEAEILQAIRAVNRQIAEDFAPRWHLSGRLRLDPALSTEAPDVDRPHQAMRGDAVLYLMDEATSRSAWSSSMSLGRSGSPGRSPCPTRRSSSWRIPR